MNNEEKILSAIEALTATVQTMQADILDLKQGQAKLESDSRTMRDKLESVHQSQIKVELEWFPKILVTMDGHKVDVEKNKEQDGRISVLEKRVDKHDVEISCLRKAE